MLTINLMTDKMRHALDCRRSYERRFDERHEIHAANERRRRAANPDNVAYRKWRATHPYCVERGAYRNAEARCTNPDKDGYKNYGGRGIKFLFESFTQFIQHIGMKPSPELTLDRICTDGNYEVGNVRWATWEQQAATRRKPCKK